MRRMRREGRWEEIRRTSVLIIIDFWYGNDNIIIFLLKEKIHFPKK
jgi:hypothetical protein